MLIQGSNLQKVLLNKGRNVCPIYPTQRGTIKTRNHHTDKANSNGKSWTRLHFLLINHLVTFTLFLLWALNNKDEVSRNAVGPSAKMKRGYFCLLAISLVPAQLPTAE